MSRPTILFVDDEEAQRYALCRFLRAHSLEVDEASSGEEALQKVLLRPYDLIVLDVKLPDMDGFQVCRRLKTNPQTAAIPVIHLSATFVEGPHRVQGLHSGAEAYLTHPIPPDELLANIRALIHGRTLARQARPAVVLSIDPDFRALHSRRCVLESQGYFVLNATAVDEAAVLLQNQRVDLVLIDADAVPAPSTIEELRKLRPDLPLLVMYSLDMSCKGAQAAVHKLDGPEVLLERIRELLRGKAMPAA